MTVRAHVVRLAIVAGLAASATAPVARAQVAPAQVPQAYRRVAAWTGNPAPAAPGTFRGPEGVAVGPDGRIYVADAVQGRVHVLAPDGSPQALWAGDLGQPSDVAVGDGVVYVADPPGERVVVVGHDGSPRATWRLPGGPAALAWHRDRLLVLLSGAAAVVVLAPDGTELARWGEPGRPMRGPRGLAVAPNGQVWVADYGARQLWRFDEAGVLLTALQVSQDGVVVAPTDVAVDANGEVYVLTDAYWYRFRAGQSIAGPFADPGGRGIAAGPGPALVTTVQDRRLGLTGLRYFRDRRQAVQEAVSWGNPFADLGMLNHPRRVSANADGHVFVLDDWPRVQDWAVDGQPRQQFGADSLLDLAAGLRGSVYGLDGHALTYWAADGQALWTWRPPSTQPTPERTISGWLTALDGWDGAVAVLDLGAQQVHVLDYSANPVAAWPVAPSGPFTSISDLALTAERVYLLNRSTRRIEARDRATGAVRANWAVPGSPIRLDADADGAVYVLTREGWVWKHAATGTPIALWPVADDGRASDLAAGPAGRVYVTFEDQDSVGVYEPDPLATPPAAPVLPDRCDLTRDKTAEPAAVQLGEAVTVRLTITGACPLADAQADIVLLVDTSGSMGGAKMAAARSAALSFVGQLDYSLHQVALVSFSTEARLVQGLTHDPRALIQAIPNLGDDGATSMYAAMKLADGELSGPRARAGVRPVVVLLTDGQPTDDPGGVFDLALAFRAAGREVYTIGLGLDVARSYLRSLATLPSNYFEAPSPYDLHRVYDTIARRVTASQLLAQATITDVLPDNMRLVSGSDLPPAQFDAATRTLTWRLAQVPPAGLELRYRLRPAAVGRWPTNVTAAADYVDGVGHADRLLFPVPEVTVRAADRWTVHLPALLKQQCPQARADVALALDTSTSMLEAAAGGGTKLEAALYAARVFVSQMHLPEDRVAVVAFHGEARRVQELSGDPAAVVAALDRLPTGSGTRLDLGLAAARAALGATAPGRVGAIVLLTDGRQSGGALADVRQVAEATRNAGIDVYMVGLGADVDVALLAEVAGRPERAFVAPGEADLARIYREIARAIPCR